MCDDGVREPEAQVGRIDRQGDVGRQLQHRRDVVPRPLRAVVDQLLQSPPDHQEVDRLLEVVARPQAQGGYDVGSVGGGGHHQHRGPGGFPETAQQLQSIAVGEVDVDEDGVEALLPESVHGRRDIPEAADGEIGIQFVTKKFEQFGLVVDDCDSRRFVHRVISQLAVRGACSTSIFLTEHA
jgi:hypothetical protein